MEVRDITIALCGAAALIGEGLEVVEPATILLEGDRIAEVGHSDEISVPHGCETVDLSGTTVTPGFIDAHVHIGFVEPSEVLRGGVTTVRDLGWPPQEIHALAARSHSADFNGPEIIAAGPILTAPGGYPTQAGWAPAGTGRAIHGPTDAGVAVEQTVGEGAKVIKIALDPRVGPVFDLPTLAAIVQAADAAGLRVTGHIYGSTELDKALDAGVHELAHMLMSDEIIPDALLRRMVDRGMTVVPTLSIREHDGRANAIRNLAAFMEAGGTTIYGTDLGNEGPRPGIDPLEVGSMAEAGFTVLDIIRSATVDAATRLGLTDRGALVPEKLADLIAFTGKLEDPRCLSNEISKVWRRGRLRAG